MNKHSKTTAATGFHGRQDSTDSGTDCGNGTPVDVAQSSVVVEELQDHTSLNIDPLPDVFECDGFRTLEQLERRSISNAKLIPNAGTFSNVDRFRTPECFRMSIVFEGQNVFEC